VTTVEEGIDIYIRYFENEIARIEYLESTLFSQILLFSILDTISRPIYPKESEEKKHKLKFVKFVGDFVNWELSQRVSLPQLLLKLQDDTTLMASKKLIK